MGGESEREWVHVYVWLGPFAVHLKLSQYCLLVGYQFSSVARSCPTLCDPMNRSMPGLPVHHQLPEFTQIHIHRVSDAIQPSHPLSSPSPPAPNPPSIKVFSNESTLRMRWPKYWRFIPQYKMKSLKKCYVQLPGNVSLLSSFLLVEC